MTDMHNTVLIIENIGVDLFKMLLSVTVPLLAYSFIGLKNRITR